MGNCFPDHKSPLIPDTDMPLANFLSQVTPNDCSNVLPGSDTEDLSDYFIS